VPYCITLRSRTDKTITGWYDGTDSRWSTDHKRQKVFDTQRDAEPVCHQLRKLCPRNASVINIETPNAALAACESDSPQFWGGRELPRPYRQEREERLIQAAI